MSAINQHALNAAPMLSSVAASEITFDNAVMTPAPAGVSAALQRVREYIGLLVARYGVDAKYIRVTKGAPGNIWAAASSTTVPFDVRVLTRGYGMQGRSKLLIAGNYDLFLPAEGLVFEPEEEVDEITLEDRPHLIKKARPIQGYGVRLGYLLKILG